jgi:hypothetical protein
MTFDKKSSCSYGGLNKSDRFRREEDKIYKLKQKIPTQHKSVIEAWDQAMKNAASCYGRIVGPNTRRIYFNAAVKFFKDLKDDYSNLYQACVTAIDECRPEQFSTRKHIKEAGISLAKFLIYKGELLND